MSDPILDKAPDGLNSVIANNIIDNNRIDRKNKRYDKKNI